jgi:hypothetical protein
VSYGLASRYRRDLGSCISLIIEMGTVALSRRFPSRSPQGNKVVKKILLIAFIVAGFGSTQTAKAGCGYYFVPQPVSARVIYLDGAPRRDGFWRCRLTPRYRWLCDGWEGPGYSFDGNIVTCY